METARMKTRKVAYMTGLGKMEVKEVPMPEGDLASNDVLVNIKAVGICASDLHFYDTGKCGELELTLPSVLGHEPAGEIVQVGSAVKHLKKDDRVFIDPQRPCGQCEHCLKGNYNLCDNMQCMSVEAEGAFAQYSVRPANMCQKLPDSLSYEAAAMLEPFSFACSVVEKGDMAPGKSVAILGSGPIGLSILLAAKAYGATDIFMTDMVANRLKKAKEMGATRVININEEDYTTVIKKETNLRGVDIVVDTTGHESSYRTFDKAVIRGGSIVLVGVGPGEYYDINLAHIRDNEIRLVGIFRFANTSRRAIDMIRTGRVDISLLVSHRIPLSQISEAFDLVRSKADGVIKVVVTMD
jgi:L-iditol 2-dehydrogenase